MSRSCCVAAMALCLWACTSKPAQQGSTTGSVCAPGQSIACTGRAGCSGGQRCNAEGTGYEDCDCGSSGASGSAGGSSGSSSTSASSASSSSGGSGGTTSSLDLQSMSLSCDLAAIGGFQDDGLTMKCTVVASDRNRQFVPNASVHFLSEAGSVPASATLFPSQNPTILHQGQAVITYTTSCPWPVDVAPDQDPADFPQGEYALANTAFYDPCATPGSEHETRTVNQRDGWATLIAYASGEECFHDINANGIFDGPTEFDPNCDEGEPYLDINDNGQYDGPGSADLPAAYQASGEPFVDVNDSGFYDGPNGQWDGQTAIWRSVHVVWTGSASAQPAGNLPVENPGTAVVEPQALGALNHCAIPTTTLVTFDINGNCPASASATDTVALGCTGDCDPVPIPLNDCAAFSLGGDPNYPKLPALVVAVNDADCLCPPNCPPDPELYQSQLVFFRTLDESDGGNYETIAVPGPSGSFGPN